jgi:putative PIN family toxin of toxin-antitoxin system
MIAAVFDAMTFLQAVTNRQGPAGACLALVDEGHVKLFVSADVLDEVRDVLYRPAIRKVFKKKLTDEIAQDFLDHVVDKAHAVEHVPNVFRLKRDPDDEPILNLAIATRASFIVSRDKDLRDLMKDDEFLKTYPGLTIIDPAAFLKHARAEIAKEVGGA